MSAHSRDPAGTRGCFDLSQAPAFASTPAAGAYSLNKRRCASMSSARHSLGPSAQGKSSGPIPRKPATARASTAPSLESRVCPPVSSACLRARLVALAQFLRGDAKTAQDHPIVLIWAMQPADPEPRDIRREERMPRTASPSGRSPAT